MTFHMSHAVIPPARHLSVKSPFNLFKGNSPYQSGSASSDEEEETSTSPGRYPSSSLSSAQAVRTADDLPDASRANRRPPDYPTPISIPAKGHIHCSALYRNKIVTGHNKELKIHTIETNSIEEASYHLSTEHENVKLSALAFKPVTFLPDGSRNVHDEGRFLWCGTRDGSMMEFDMHKLAVTCSKTNIHTAPVMLLERCGSKMISLDESGKIGLWQEKGNGLSLKEAPITQRITMEKNACAFMIGLQLWVASTPQETTSASSKTALPRLRIYQPFYDDKPFNATSRPSSIPDSMGGEGVGQVTCGVVLPARPEVVFLGHINGFVSIWSRTTYSCIAVQRVAISVTSLAGVGHIRHYLWAGEKLGKIKVFDVSCTPWLVLKEWEAHDSAVMALHVDTTRMNESKLPVLSSSLEGQLHIWDGLLSSDWLFQQLEEREAEYSSYRTVNIRMFSYNVDGNPTSAFEDRGFPDMAKVFSSSEGEAPEVIVFGLQELVELDDTKIVAKSFLFGGAGRRAKGKGTEGKGAEVSDRISHQYKSWQGHFSEEIRKHAPVSYTMVLTDNLVGLFTAVFVRDSEMSNTKDTRIVSLKTGFGGRMGNKGALAASLTIDDTSIALVNCHLAAGQRKVRHRNADLVDILDTAMYQSRSGQVSEAFTGGGDGSMILDHRVVILSGDLNFRIELSRDHCLELIAQENYSGLLAKDQLRRESRQNPAFRLHHFVEAPITFLPTYKYKNFTDEWDPSEKRRVPSYCDRILWHCRKDDIVECKEYDRIEYLQSDHRPITAHLTVKVRRSDREKRADILRKVQDEWPHLIAEAMSAAKSYYQ